MTGMAEPRVIREDVPWSPATATSDALVVPTWALGARVRAWREHWDETVYNPSNPFGEADEDDNRMSSLQYLQEWSGINERQIRYICDEEYVWTGLRLADAILTAMHEHHLLESDPDLRPRPNPHWSQERWMQWKADQGCV